MESEDRDTKIAIFQSITDKDAQTTTSYLEGFNWDVDLAVSKFLDERDGAVCKDPKSQASKLQ